MFGFRRKRTVITTPTGTRWVFSGHEPETVFQAIKTEFAKMATGDFWEIAQAELKCDMSPDIELGMIFIGGTRDDGAGRIDMDFETVRGTRFRVLVDREEIASLDHYSLMLDDSARGTGRTIAAQLETIAFAIRRPNQWITFMDDRGPGETYDKAEDYVEMLKEKVSELHLRFLETRIHDGLPQIRFNWALSDLDTESRGWRTTPCAAS